MKLKKDQGKPKLSSMGGRVNPREIGFWSLDAKTFHQAARVEFDVAGGKYWTLKDFHSTTRRAFYLGFCCCREDEPARFSVRKRQGQYQIVRCPVHGVRHAIDCENWPNLLTRAPFTRETLNEVLDMLFEAKSVGGKSNDGSSTSEGHLNGGARTTRSGPSSSGASLKALIDDAGLNEYDPDDRDSAPNGYLALRLQRVLDARAHCMVIDGKTRLKPVLVHKNGPVDLTLVPRTVANKAVQPIVLIGSVERTVLSDGTIKVYLEGESVPIAFKKESWNRSVARTLSPRTTAHLLKSLASESPPRARVLAAISVTWDGNGEMQGHHVGLCPTTRELIPVESLHELEMANYLIGQKRHFIKDITRPQGYKYIPDFRLLDMGLDFIIEVNGMNTPEYLAGKEAAMEYLAAEFPDRHLVWKPWNDRRLPVLPESLQRRLRRE